MADRPVPNGASVLERMRTRTTCPKCRERYKEPKLLPCNHSVCRDCLVLKKGVRKGRGLDYIVTCPACNAEAELKKNRLDGLPTAFFKQRMSRACSRLEKVVEGKGCEECGDSEAGLAGFCRDCERVLCSDCRTAHGKLKSLVDHVVIGMEEFSREIGGATADEDPAATNSLLGASSEAMLCPSHGDSLKLYCRTCRVLVCPSCTVNEHAPLRHKVELVDKLVPGLKAELEGGVAAIRDNLTVVRKSAKERVRLQQDIAEEKKQLCLVLDHVFQELQLSLEHRKRKLVREIDKRATEETEKISQELVRFETKSSELDGLMQACSEALHHTTDQEFMVLRRDLQTRLKEVAVRKPTSPVPTMLPSLQLPLSCAGEIESACKELALTSLFVSHSKSTVHKVRSSVEEVGREVQVIFSALTNDGKPCLEPLEIECTVTVPRFEEDIDTAVTPGLSAGTYQVTFTPTKKGEHLVFISVRGQEIESCPFPVPVRSNKLDLGLPENILVKTDWAWGVACGKTNRLIYVTEQYNHCISVWDKNRRAVNSLGQKGQKPGQILSPRGIAINRAGEIYIADGKDVGRIQKLSKAGQLLEVYVGLSEPCGVTLNAAEDRVYVCDSGSQPRVAVFDAELKFLESFGELSCSLEGYQATATDTLESPHSVALDVSGNVYITDTMSQHIHVYDDTGAHIRSIGYPHDEEFAPSGIAIEDEHIFVSDRSGNQIVMFTTSGDFVMATGSYGTAEGQFQNPSGVAVDMDGYLYVCDFGNSRVQVF